MPDSSYMAFLSSPSSWNFNIDNYVNPFLPPAPWKYIPRPISRFFGHRDKPQQSIGNIVIIYWAFIGVFFSLLLIEAVGHYIPPFKDHEAPIIVGSFGAAAVLEFYAIDSPLAQPRNAILGHILSSLVGISVNKLFALAPQSLQLTWVAGSLSCACAVSVMGLTGTIHPPAGATALLAVVDDSIANLGWFLLPVILLDCVLMQCVALLFNNIQRRFPDYWWTPEEVGQKWRRKEVEENGMSESDSDLEKCARLECIASHHVEGDMAQVGQRILITKGLIKVPEDLCLTPKEKMVLEELSERL